MTWKSKFASALTAFDRWEILNTESIFYWLGGMFKQPALADWLPFRYLVFGLCFLYFHRVRIIFIPSFSSVYVSLIAPFQPLFLYGFISPDLPPIFNYLFNLSATCCACPGIYTILQSIPGSSSRPITSTNSGCRR